MDGFLLGFWPWVGIQHEQGESMQDPVRNAMQKAYLKSSVRLHMDVMEFWSFSLAPRSHHHPNP